MNIRHASYGFVLLSVACIMYLGIHWGQAFFLGFMPSHFSLKKSPHEYSVVKNGTTVNLPRIIASVDDGEQFFSLQTTIAVELDHADMVSTIRGRHELIDRHLMELFRSYSLKDLRSAGPPPTLRYDIKRVINALLPESGVRNAYVTSWLMIPAGY
jgi:flagellar basal body-associated protein FliL